MPSDEPTPASLGAEEFFAMVDALLTPPMAALGYHRIGASVNDQPGSRGGLTSGGQGATATQPTDDLPFLWFELGIEAGSVEVARLVRPGDPQVDEEWWVGYEPATGRLELSHWEPVTGGEVDWDIVRDEGPCPPPEVRRRLEAVGRAVSTFVQRHGGFPLPP